MLTKPWTSRERLRSCVRKVVARRSVRHRRHHYKLLAGDFPPDSRLVPAARGAGGARRRGRAAARTAAAACARRAGGRARLRDARLRARRQPGCPPAGARPALAAVPGDAQGFRVDRFGLPLDARAYRQADRRVTACARTRCRPSGSGRVVLFRELRVQGELVEIAAVDGWPRSSACVRAACRDLHERPDARCCRSAPAAARASLEGDVRLRRVGVAEPPRLRPSSATSRPRRRRRRPQSQHDAAPRPRRRRAPAARRARAVLPGLLVAVALSGASGCAPGTSARILAAESRAQAALGAADSALSPERARRRAARRGRARQGRRRTASCWSAARRARSCSGSRSSPRSGCGAGSRTSGGACSRAAPAAGRSGWRSEREIGSMTLAGARRGHCRRRRDRRGDRRRGRPAGRAILGHSLAAGRAIAALAGGWAATTLVLALTTLTQDDEVGSRPRSDRRRRGVRRGGDDRRRPEPRRARPGVGRLGEHRAPARPPRARLLRGRRRPRPAARARRCAPPSV